MSTAVAPLDVAWSRLSVQRHPRRPLLPLNAWGDLSHDITTCEFTRTPPVRRPSTTCRTTDLSDRPSSPRPPVVSSGWPTNSPTPSQPAADYWPTWPTRSAPRWLPSEAYFDEMEESWAPTQTRSPPCERKRHGCVASPGTSRWPPPPSPLPSQGRHPHPRRCPPREHAAAERRRPGHRAFSRLLWVLVTR